MITRENIIELASKQGIGCGKAVTLSDAESAELERIANGIPELSADDLSRMFLLLRRRLAWQEVDRAHVAMPQDPIRLLSRTAHPHHQEGRLREAIQPLYAVFLQPAGKRLHERLASVLPLLGPQFDVEREGLLGGKPLLA